MNKIRQDRLKTEFKDIQQYKQFSVKIDEENNDIWYVSFKGVKGTLYENEDFTLKFQFFDRFVILILYIIFFIAN